MKTRYYHASASAEDFYNCAYGITAAVNFYKGLPGYAVSSVVPVTFVNDNVYIEADSLTLTYGNEPDACGVYILPESTTPETVLFTANMHVAAHGEPSLPADAVRFKITFSGTGVDPDTAEQNVWYNGQSTYPFFCNVAAPSNGEETEITVKCEPWTPSSSIDMNNGLALAYTPIESLNKSSYVSMGAIAGGVMEIKKKLARGGLGVWTDITESHCNGGTGFQVKGLANESKGGVLVSHDVPTWILAGDCNGFIGDPGLFGNINRHPIKCEWTIQGVNGVPFTLESPNQYGTTGDRKHFDTWYTVGILPETAEDAEITTQMRVYDENGHEDTDNWQDRFVRKFKFVATDQYDTTKRKVEPVRGSLYVDSLIRPDNYPTDKDITKTFTFSFNNNTADQVTKGFTASQGVTQTINNEFGLADIACKVASSRSINHEFTENYTTQRTENNGATYTVSEEGSISKDHEDMALVFWHARITSAHIFHLYSTNNLGKTVQLNDVKLYEVTWSSRQSVYPKEQVSIGNWGPNPF